MTRTSPSDLHDLAMAAGVHRHWRTVEGEDCTVADDPLAVILDAIGYATGSPRQIRAGLDRIEAQRQALPKLLISAIGRPTPIPVQADRADLTDEQGVTRTLAIQDGALAPVDAPGYYDLSVGGRHIRLAVAPGQCPLPGMDGRRAWGVSLQIASLRGADDLGFGGLGELDGAVKALGRLGCQAVAINPVHALFPGVGSDFSPYSPSSRTYLNAALADPALLGLPALPPAPGGDLIDWPSAMPARLQALRQSFAALDPAQRAQLAAGMRDCDPGLYRHALHDALFCHFRPQGAADWRAWPEAYRHPDSPEVRAFAAGHPDDIAFHLYAQGLARDGLAVVQRDARASGMAIGLIADLAVGVHPGGSDCWSMREAMLTGLTIGAPPDPLGPLGQNWSITGFSPDGLRATGYAPWIAMIRSALHSAGGLRIDHAFGLARLWVIPEGGACSDGAYLGFPFEDLVRLVALEAHRAGALIIAEDLGTAPPGFTHAVSCRNMLGMRVLWFERAADHGFIGARDYPPGSVAMTGTHDTPTVAGWWRGRDLDWAERLGRLPPDVDRQRAGDIRAWDRGLLWSTIGQGPRPADDDPGPVVAAALGHIGQSPAMLAIAPVEDLLAEIEQPNLPGTTHEHPNWRRRLAAPLDDLLCEPATAERVSALAQGRVLRSCDSA